MISIGRDTIFGNPVQLGKPCPVCGKTHSGAGSTGGCFRRYLEARLSGEKKLEGWALGIARSVRGMPVKDGFLTALKGLHGQELRCPGCVVGAPTCHGRILEEFALRLNAPAQGAP